MTFILMFLVRTHECCSSSDEGNLDNKVPGLVFRRQGHDDGQHSASSQLPQTNAQLITQLIAKADHPQSDEHKTPHSVSADHTVHDLGSLLGSAPAPHGGHDDLVGVIHLANN